jgi:uncharacterized protein (TIGR02145 family)
LTSSAEQCCGNDKYALATHFCYSNSKVGEKCGARTETYDPDLYKCVDNGKIYLKTPASYGGENYEAVLIGSQTWLARNLNYEAEGSLCYNNNPANCAQYGRLYNWATAMNGAASSSAVPSGVQGVCPTGWHIPSRAEWEVMTAYIGGAGTEGKKLKATSGWNNNGNGTDDYGFSALPGGARNNAGFASVGKSGCWWSASVNSSNSSLADYRQMEYDNAYWNGYAKSLLGSVRCVKD